jgi:molybdate transport system substrate-binding protein
MKRIVAALALVSPGFVTSVVACGGERESSPPAPVELTVYAATSLRDALQELGKAFEEKGGDKLTFNFGSSGDLSRQIVAANQADFFFSADEQELDRVEQAGLVEAGTRRALLSNQLVVIEPAGTPSLFRSPFGPEQLASAELELLSLANTDTVPAGKYARAWLQSRGVWDRVASKVLPGVDVRAALAAVESGGARAGIVYRTDAARSSKVRVVFAVPMAEGPPISYPLAVLVQRPNAVHAQQLAQFLASEEALAVFERHGFLPRGRSE